MGNGQSCFFIGHREAPESLRPALVAAVRRCVDEGVTEFIVGHYGRFDALASSVVKELRKQYSDVRLVLLIPYHPTERPVELSTGFDASFYPPGMEMVPRSLAIKEADRRTIREVNRVIAYVRHPGNARDLAEYAEKRGARIDYI